jgi:ribonuclease BN (tRNA processing enzyme)
MCSSLATTVHIPLPHPTSMSTVCQQAQAGHRPANCSTTSHCTATSPRLPTPHHTTPTLTPSPLSCCPTQAAKQQLGLREFEPFPVHHIAHATGLRLVGAEGWSLVFSGDTRPCERLVQAAQGCDLLVHEATFADDEQGQAERKKHSTLGEALEMGTRSGAYRWGCWGAGLGGVCAGHRGGAGRAV